MVKLIFAILITIFVSIIVFVASKKNKFATFGAALIVFSVGIGASLITIVPANHVGIVYSEVGGVQDYTFSEGIHIKAPWITVYQINTEVEGLTFADISVQTQDSQWVKTELQVQLAVDKANALPYFTKYKDKKVVDIESLIRSTIQRELEAETTKANIMELLGEKRSELVNAVTARLQKEFLKDGIRLDRIILVDTDAGEQIENSIAREAAAKKDAQTAEHLKKKAQEEGEAKKIAAELAAQAKIAEAKGEAEALRLVAEALRENPSLIQIEWIKKWNGELPEVTAGDSGIILDLSNLKKTE